MALAGKGEPEKAAKLMQQVLEIEQSIFGEADEELLGTLDYLAKFAHATGDWDREIEFRRRALKIARLVLKEGDYRIRDLELAVTESRNNAARTADQQQQLDRLAKLNGQALALHRQGDFANAIQLAKQIKSVREEVLGKQHPDYAISLSNLAMFYSDTGDYRRAEPMYLEVKAIWEKVLGKQHPYYALSLNNLAVLYSSMGDFERAEQLYLETKAIWKKALGKKHPRYALSLNNLAAIYVRMGDYERAETLYVEAKAIREEVLGNRHPDYAVSLNHLAELYRAMGDFPRAEPLYLEAMAIREEVLGKHHPVFAVSLNNLASFYSSMGDLERAEPLYVEAMAILEKLFGKQHPDYAISLNNLAVLYHNMGDYGRAEPLYMEAKAIREKVLGKQHPNFAVSVGNLAVLYSSMGDLERAEPLYVEAMAILKKVLGKRHPMLATSLNNLAGLYRDMSDYGHAETLYEEALSIREQTLGKQHPDYAASLNNLARLYSDMGDDERAEPLYQQSLEITLKHLEQTASIQTELQQLHMTGTVRYQLDSYLRCCLEGGFNPRDAITHVVAWKGAILRRARGQRLAASDPAIADQFRQLQSVASQLSAATRSIPKPQQMEAWRNRLNALAEQQQKLESELVRRSDVFRQAVKKVSLDSVCQSIPEGGVLVDFLEYNGKDGRSLLASVIRHNGDPVLIELGSAAEAGEAIDAWRESYGMTSEAKAAGAKLREQLWEPLHEHVDDAELILVSTDGVLGRFPLAALPGSNADRFLIEEHRIASIPVPGLLPDLVADQDTEDAHAHDLLLMGNVDYGAPDSSGREPTTAPAIETLAATRAAHGLQWPQLAETGREIDAIKKLYQQAEPTRQNTIIDLQEASATESAFRNQAPKCKLIHLATHGFFAPADKKNALSPEAIAESQDMTRLGQQREGFVGFSPGQLSGLVFAGANRPPESLGSLRDGVQNDDGIMTADEIAYLPLNNVDLAVLSACETGLGEVAGGEGLIGIQRAFQVSGVDSVVATMWKVDDTMTRVLMERFYRNLFEKKMSKLDALREAQLSLLHGQGLDSTTLRGLGTKTVKVDVTVKPEPNQGQRLSPRYWAPFVLSGDWR